MPKISGYQTSHREQPCIFRQEGYGPCFGSVTGHHVRIPGTGLRKPHDVFAIPCCDNHHKQCHTSLALGGIPRDEQIERWRGYAYERAVTAGAGVQETCETLGAAFWKLIKGELDG